MTLSEHLDALLRAVRNAWTLIKNPRIAREYCQYVLTAASRGRAMRRYPEGFSLTGFRRFTEYLGAREPVSAQERLFFQRLPLKSGVLVDVGANLGFVSMLLATKYPGAEVYAFEPNPSTFSALEANVVLNAAQNVLAFPFVVSDKDGDEWFNADPVDRFRASIARHDAKHRQLVPSVRLDTFCRHNSIDLIDLLKVDVEGFEGAVFDGAEGLLVRKRIRIIFFECGLEQSSLSGYSVQYPFERLLNFGYSIHRILRDGSIAPATVADIPYDGYTNFVATADSSFGQA